jgi:radical SAM superfamily enzyme YgiQ (UPF0313 family)
LYRGRVRFRSVPNVVGEIETIIEDFGIRSFHFYDDNFLADRSRVLQFCKEVTEKDLDIKWACLSHVRSLDFKTLRTMKEAGCLVLELGIESWNQRILDIAQKYIALEEIERSIDMIIHAGITPQFLFMRGHIGETPESLKNTYDAIEAIMTKALRMGLRHSSFCIQNATPFPGTKFYDIASEYGQIVSRNWDEYETLKITFVPQALERRDLEFDPYRYVSARVAASLFRERSSYIEGLEISNSNRVGRE